MNNKNETTTIEETETELSTTSSAQPAANDGEFKVTVRKLEMPVRPRGVLAE